MTDLQTKLLLRDAITRFSTQSLRTASLGLFASLGYQSDRTIAIDSVDDFCAQFDSSGLLAHPRAQKSNWTSIELLFQLTDEELSSNATLFKDSSVRSSLLQSYVFFAVELKSGDYTRGKLAAITRQINRIFPMPVMVLYKEGGNISIAVINRRKNKRDESKDVLGKVTLIQNISIVKPHSGHLDILASFSTVELTARKKPIGNFDQLHAAWEDVFNVELLNKRFYEELSNWYFWARKQVSFPADLEPEQETRNSTSVIRLLTRLIFCWFLKEKDLIPNHIFDQDAIADILNSFEEQESTYYHAILQNLFFATLNQPMNIDGKPVRQFAADSDFQENRNQHGVKTLYRYQKSFREPLNALSLFEEIPFLNGGLFACLDMEDDKGKVQYADGFSRNAKKQPIVPNRLFFAAPQIVDLSEDYNDVKKKKVSVRGLIHILQSYKFTIAESTPVEQEIALDPELLGNVFENLLASYNPETGESARKQTGSFYTPRPIVDYMVDESLKAYLARALRQAMPKTTEADAKAGLDILFAYTEREHVFSKPETAALINAIDACNILDPACGSGAYPMGILHKLVFILGKLDPSNAQWKQRQIDKAEEIEDAEARESAVRAIERDFTDNNLDYGRKLYLIENCIYGVDIQPIAIQISKLRFFISLVCDQKTSHDKSRNRGVRPLPNLEIKFVVANTLIALTPRKTSKSDLQTQIGLLDTDVQALEEQLAKVRHRYFSAQTRKQKVALQIQDRKLVAQIVDALGGTDDSNLGIAEVRRRIQWNPYDHHSVADFFEPSTMFGRELEHGFDVVIGNPPYVQIQKFNVKQKSAWIAQGYATYGATADIYCLFYERGVQLLKEGGHLSYITSNRWMRTGYGEALRGWMSNEVNIQTVLDFGMGQNFGAATTYTCIVHLTKQPTKSAMQACYAEDTKAAMEDPAAYFVENASYLSTIGQEPWVIVPPTMQRIKSTVEKQGTQLSNWKIRINRGILTGYNKAFYLNDHQRAALIKADPKSEDLIVPLLRGRGVSRYAIDWDKLDADDEKWLINAHNGLKESKLPAIDVKRDYPAIWKHLQEYESILVKRLDQGDDWSNLRNCAYLEDFSKPKIIYPNITKFMPFFYDENKYFSNDATYILASEIENLPALTAQLNSTLFRYCFKDNFPELLGNSSKLGKIFFDKIPLKRPSPEQERVLETLVRWVQAEKCADKPSFKTAFVESVIDACVLEMYFEDEMQRCDLSFFERVSDSLKTTKTLEAFYELANDSKHPIRNGLLRLPVDSPELFAVIQESEGA